MRDVRGVMANGGNGHFPSKPSSVDTGEVDALPRVCTLLSRRPGLHARRPSSEALRLRLVEASTDPFCPTCDWQSFLNQAGPGAVDCGTAFRCETKSWPPVVDCALDASRKKRPFRVVISHCPIDGSALRAFVGEPDGGLLALEYGSDTSPESCDGTLEASPCDGPLEADAHDGLHCHRAGLTMGCIEDGASVFCVQHAADYVVLVCEPNPRFREGNPPCRGRRAASLPDAGLCFAIGLRYIGDCHVHAPGDAAAREADGGELEECQ